MSKYILLVHLENTTVICQEKIISLTIPGPLHYAYEFCEIQNLLKNRGFFCHFILPYLLRCIVYNVLRIIHVSPKRRHGMNKFFFDHPELPLMSDRDLSHLPIVRKYRAFFIPYSLISPSSSPSKISSSSGASVNSSEGFGSEDVCGRTESLTGI